MSHDLRPVVEARAGELYPPPGSRPEAEAGAAQAWTFLPSLVVRSTGFPFELLERLRFPRTTDVVRRLLAGEREIEALRRRLLAEDFPAAVRRAAGDEQQRASLSRLSTWRRAVGRGRTVGRLHDLPPAETPLAAVLRRWNELLTQHATLHDTGAATWETELRRGRAALREIAGQARVQEAIFLSNPQLYATVRRYAGGDAAGLPGSGSRDSATRKLERRLVTYLQRLCAKNETQSFFGPVDYGRLDPQAPANLRLRRAPEALRRREAFPSQWAAEALAGSIGADPEVRPYLRPRRDPACILDAAGRLWFPALARRLPLEPAARRLFGLADGRRTVAELAGLLQEPWEATWQRLAALRAQGAVVATLIVPGDVEDPLAYLQRWLAALPPG